jgi:hypothetical protein
VSSVGARQEPRARNSDATITAPQVAPRGETQAEHRRCGISHAKTTRQTARKRCNNAGAAWIEARHPRASAASLLQQPFTRKQQHVGVAERGVQQKSTQTAAVAAPAHTHHTQPNTREQASKRASMLHSCHARTGGAPWASWSCRARRPTRVRPPSAFISSRSACISARSIHCRESETREERSEC